MEQLQLKIKNYFILAALFFLPIYLIKIRIGWFSLNMLEILIGILFVLWFFSSEAKHKILNTKYKIPIILISFGLLLSVIANRNYYIGLGAIKGWFFFPIIFGIIFYDALKKDGSSLKRSMLALFFSGVAVSVVGVVYEILGFLTYDGRLKIFWGSPNQLAMFLAVPFLIGADLVISRLSLGKFPRLSLIISSVIIVINLYLTKSYGTWLALSIALIVIFWLKYSKIKHKKHLAIFATILLIFLGWASASKYNSIKISGDRSSLSSRLAIWKSAGRMIEKNPLFGIGPGNFQNKYLEYQKYFPPYLEWSAPQPHNIFLAFWLESGLLGLAGFIILLVYFFRDNKKVYPLTKINESDNAPIREIKKKASSSLASEEDFGGGAINNLRILLLGIMIYILVHGLVDTTYWRNDLAVVFWVVIAANASLATSISKPAQ